MTQRPRRLGLLGGTFDPIHLGHLILASRASESLGLDKVLFIPAQVPPHKLDETISPATDRIAMVQSAIKGDNRFEFSDYDLRSSEPSFTSDLVERIVNDCPDIEFYFLVGADSLRDFPTWHQPGKIIENVKLAVARRQGVAISEAMMTSVPLLRHRIRIFDSPLIDISSTGIRERVKSGKSIRYLVPHGVEQYIREHALYADATPQ